MGIGIRERWCVDPDRYSHRDDGAAKQDLGLLRHSEVLAGRPYLVGWLPNINQGEVHGNER